MAKGIKLKDKDGDIFPCPYFPIGSIYMSVNSTNPSAYFGGTWEQIKDTFLLACGNTYSNGATGGEAEHTLTTDEMPNHNHNIARKHGGTGFSTPYSEALSGWGINGMNTGATIGCINNTGGGQAHNNMPPYLAVYVWKRTA